MPNKRLDVNRRFNLTETSAGCQESLRSSWSNPDVLFPDQSTCADRSNRIFLQLHLLIQTEGDDGGILGKIDILHTPDPDPGDLHGRTHAETGHRGEHRGQIIPIPLAYLELAETHRELRQGTQT